MNMKNTMLPISLVALLGFGSAAQAAVTQITSNSTNDMLPQVSNNYAVWQGQVGGSWEIFLHNLSTSTTTQITTNAFDDVSPQLDGNYVTWLENGFSGGRIQYYDIAAGGPAIAVPAIPAMTQVNAAPQIANGKIVWTNNTVGGNVDPGEIYMYDISAGGSPINLSSSTYDDTAPRINDTIIVWNQIDEMGTADPTDDVTTVRVYDIASTTVADAAVNFIWPESPQVDGNLSVYSQHDGSDREIFLKEAQLPSQQITNNAIEDTYPRISGAAIVWVGGEGNAAEIYSFMIVADTDADGIPDTSDNCTEVPNADQRDSNGDGYGNMCDGDLNNDGVVNTFDLALFNNAFATTDPHADFDGNGVVNTFDLAYFNATFGKYVGPSGTAP